MPSSADSLNESDAFLIEIRQFGLEKLTGVDVFPEADLPFLSVILPVFQSRHYLEETLSSIALQHYRDYEVIVVDGGSSDGTVDMLKSLSNVKWISEPDSGYTDAFQKGLKIAKGKAVIQCCASDGFLSARWFDLATTELLTNDEISLVWSLPRYMSEKGDLGRVSFPQFHKQSAPSGMEFYIYWLSTGFWYPEGNFCVRRNVLNELFPTLDEVNDSVEPYLEFNFRFNKAGYLSAYIPGIMNFGRTHDDSITKTLHRARLADIQLGNYRSQVSRYRASVLSRSEVPCFRTEDGRLLDWRLPRGIRLKVYGIQLRATLQRILRGLARIKRANSAHMNS